MILGKFVSVKGRTKDAYLVNERDFEELIREHMGDDAGDLFRDLMSKAASASIQGRLQKLNGLLGDALDDLQRAGEIVEEMDDLLDD